MWSGLRFLAAGYLRVLATGLFLKAQLYSSYIWGFNYRPFGTGLFGDHKRRLLNVFLAVETPDGTCFTKYGPVIARDMGLPWGTRAHKLAVWDRVAAWPSCNQALEFPKLGRWFSWNGAAHTQMQEFHALKMILEWHLEGDNVADPDEAGAAFDDLAPTTSARTHQQQLAQLVLSRWPHTWGSHITS